MGLFADLRRAWRRFSARSSRERSQLIVTLARRLRSDGVSGVLTSVRRNSVADNEAARYLEWCARHTPGPEDLRRMRTESARFDYQPLITIVTPVYNTDARWLDACADSVVAQAYPNWQWIIGNDGSTKADTLAALDRIAVRDPRIRVLHAPANAGVASATNLALTAAEGDYVALMDHDDALLPHALFRMVEALNQATPRPDVLYSDEDKLDLDGVRCDAYFKPDWSPDLFLSSMFVCHLLMARRSLIAEIGGFRSEYDFAQDYDLMLRLMERAGHIAHVPDVLYHWRKIPQSTAAAGTAKPTAHLAGRRAIQDYLDRNGLDGEVLDAGPPGLYRVKYRLRRQPLVSIVIPTRGRAGAERLAALLETLNDATAYRNFEIVIVSGDGGVPPGADALLASQQHRLIRASHQAFNFSASINQGVAASRGEQILILHDDVKPLDAEWLEALLELSEQPGIGAVGAKLYYPHGALQHIGLVLGLGAVAGRPFQGHNAESLGYFSAASCIRNYSAVSGVCLMTRRDVFTTVGGFDEQLPTHGSDVDYCLRVRDAGMRIVFTPYARLVHYEDGKFDALPVDTTALAHLRARWGTALDRDPFYNPNLSRDTLDYRVAP